MQASAPSRHYDWSAPSFLPIDIDMQPGAVALSAGGQTVVLRGELFRADADGALTATWAVERREFLVLSLALAAPDGAFLREVAWLPGAWDGVDERVVNATAHQDNVLFLRAGDVSFFLSLDFPCSRIGDGGIAYPPHARLAAGEQHVAHTLTLGACRLSGTRVGDYDRAEIEAVSAYIERRFPPRFNRPMFTSSCITNRMTYCQEDRVFYAIHDNPTLALDPKLLAEDVRLMARIGVEYLQVFEGQFDWPDQQKTGAALRKIVALGNKLGVRIGDYINPQGLYCGHYNYEKRDLARDEWRQRAQDGSPGNYCLGCREYLDFFVDDLIEHNRQYGEEFICFDFLGIEPCYAENHGHPPGDVYHQVRALVEIFARLNALSPDYQVWSNSGNWLEFMPKLVWWNQNVYLTDPHVREYSSTLSALKLFGDMRREQMVSVHERYFVPYRHFTNCEYYAFPRSRVPDLQVFEYSFLQGLAVTPNICPCETRVFLDRVPSKDRERCIRFMRHWTDFITAHFDVWQHTARVGDAPGQGATEIYAHVAGDHGFVCLVNQNPFPRTARFTLDGAIGLAGGERFTVSEVYPRACAIAEQPLPFARFGDAMACALPPHSVRFLEIAPYAEPAGVQVFGLPARARRVQGGYRLTLKAPQGETVRLGLVLPPGEGVAAVAARQAPTVPLYTFPAAAAIVAADGHAAWLDVTFPRERAPRALTRWQVDGADVELPRDGCAFLGGLVHNAFHEDYTVILDVRTAPVDHLGSLPPAPLPPVASASVPAAPRQTFVTEFVLPFIEPVRWGCMPDTQDDTVLELAFRDPARVAALAARLNGQPVEVRRHVYPRRPDWHAWHIDLTGQTGPGAQRLEIDVTWAGATR